ncbi:putative mitochondrial hypothetical protein [Leptomonas pyrrhocoris]|uniref:Uncharacterized protein n=1 Tax=Leptomonas pyrrhocoris TaxID=157538 RepID=A0A0M9G4T0_LEPPY|nr:putative mitochondrial hypothetical protein [Leptomonas pyrrhocoris]KPA82420.1 putative mitochondrial hypothetical protein [Leptomonas pyrrhocoris]|eukprot:XP_015660859.1 putative mitochondrial hypothetical protein [Leptomonas pyrrhocoris]
MKAFTGVTVSGATPALRRTTHHLLRTILTLDRAPYDAQLRVHFVSLQHIHHLNHTFKGVDRPTDVLTFSSTGAADSFVNDLLFGDEDCLGGVADEPNLIFGVEAGPTPHQLSSSSPSSSADDVGSRLSRSMVRLALVDLGDIYVSLEYMQNRFNASPSRCLPLVPYFNAAMVHATLHALGYNHTTPQELLWMVRREQQLGCRLAALSRRSPGYLPPPDLWDTK